ncbi:UNVERIFIED_CONTAM: TetR family transcriptional regulator [Mumia flava]
MTDCALTLFEKQGYDATTVREIAGAAGVTEMTFFRHFATKESVLLDDPYDPAIANAVAHQPPSLPPLARAVGGVREAWGRVPEPEDATVRRRVRIAAATPSLRAGVSRNNAETERVIAEALESGGSGVLPARIAAAAVLAALTTALFAWAEGEDTRLAFAIETALATLEGSDG